MRSLALCGTSPSPWAESQRLRGYGNTRTRQGDGTVSLCVSTADPLCVSGVTLFKASCPLSSFLFESSVTTRQQQQQQIFFSHLLGGHHQTVVGSDEHVLETARVHAASLETGGIVHARHDLLHLLGGHLRMKREEEKEREKEGEINQRGRAGWFFEKLCK